MKINTIQLSLLAIVLIGVLVFLFIYYKKQNQPAMACREMPLDPADAEPLLGGVFSKKKWPFEVGKPKILKVYFLDSPGDLPDRLMACLKPWQDCTGIHFSKVGEYGKPDVIVAISGVESWSHIGKDCKGKHIAVTFGGLSDKTTSQELSRIVLHEFGHVLGFVHEHSLPDGNPIKWNEDEVYKYYESSKVRWTKDQIRENIFARYDRNTFNNNATFDPSSIMVYAIPEKFTTNNVSIRQNFSLSAGDKRIANQEYNSM